jgi:hypothetical protein
MACATQELREASLAVKVSESIDMDQRDVSRQRRSWKRDDHIVRTPRRTRQKSKRLGKRAAPVAIVIRAKVPAG